MHGPSGGRGGKSSARCWMMKALQDCVGPCGKVCEIQDVRVLVRVCMKALEVCGSRKMRMVPEAV